MKKNRIGECVQVCMGWAGYDTTREIGERLLRSCPVNSEGGEVDSPVGAVIFRGAFQAAEQQVQRPWGGMGPGMFERAPGLGQSEEQGEGGEVRARGGQGRLSKALLAA